MMEPVPFAAPWGAPTASPVPGSDAQIVAPSVMGGLPQLASPAPVLPAGTLAYFAPPLVEGLPFLAPQFVPVILLLPEQMNGGGRARRSSIRTATRAKTAPAPVHVPYHSRAYEQDARAAAELDDEETILAFLMEYALV